MSTKKVGGIEGSVSIDASQANKELKELQSNLKKLRQQEKDLNRVRDDKSLESNLKSRTSEIKKQTESLRELAAAQKEAVKQAKQSEASADDIKKVSKEYEKTKNSIYKLNAEMKDIDRMMDTLASNKSASVLAHNYKSVAEQIEKATLRQKELNLQLGKKVRVMPNKDLNGDLKVTAELWKQAKAASISLEDVRKDMSLLTDKMRESIEMKGFYGSDLFKDWDNADVVASEIDKVNAKIKQLAPALRDASKEYSRLQKEILGKQISWDDDMHYNDFGRIPEEFKDFFNDAGTFKNTTLREARQEMALLVLGMVRAIERAENLTAAYKNLNKAIKDFSTKNEYGKLMKGVEGADNISKDTKTTPMARTVKMYQSMAREGEEALDKLINKYVEVEWQAVDTSNKEVQANNKVSDAARKAAETYALLQERKNEKLAKTLALQEEISTKDLSVKDEGGTTSLLENVTADAKKASMGLVDVEKNINLITDAMYKNMKANGFRLSDITTNELTASSIKEISHQLLSQKAVVAESKKALADYVASTGKAFSLADYNKTRLIPNDFKDDSKLKELLGNVIANGQAMQHLEKRMNAVRQGYAGLNRVIQESADIGGKSLTDAQLNTFMNAEANQTKLIQENTKAQTQAYYVKKKEKEKLAEQEAAAVLKQLRGEEDAARRAEIAQNAKTEAARKSAELYDKIDRSQEGQSVSTEPLKEAAVDAEKVATELTEANAKTKEVSSSAKVMAETFDTSSYNIKATRVELDAILGKLKSINQQKLLPQGSDGDERATVAKYTGNIMDQFKQQMRIAFEEMKRTNLEAFLRSAAEQLSLMEGLAGNFSNKTAMINNEVAKWLTQTNSLSEAMLVLNALATGDYRIMDVSNLRIAVNMLTDIIAKAILADASIGSLGTDMSRVFEYIRMGANNALNPLNAIMQRMLQLHALAAAQSYGNTGSGFVMGEGSMLGMTKYVSQARQASDAMGNIKRLTAGVAKANQELVLYTGQYTYILKSSVKLFPNLTSNIKKAASAAAAILAPIRAIPHNIKKATSEVYGMSNGFKDVSRIVSGIVISQAFYQGMNKVQEGMRGIVDAFKETETASIAFGAMFKNIGDSAQYVKMLQDFAAVTPFNFSDTVKNARMLAAYGFQAKEVLPIMNQLSDAAAATGDSSSFERIARAMGQIRSKGRLMGEEIRQLQEAGISAASIMQEELGLSADEMARIGDLRIPADTAIKALLKGVQNRYGGASKALSKSVTGLLSTIGDNVKLIGMAMTGDLFNAYRGWLDDLSNRLARVYATVSKVGFGGWMNQAFSPESAGLIRNMIANLQSFWASVRTMWQAIKPIFTEFIRLFVIIGNIVNPVLTLMSRLFFSLMSIITSNITIVRMFVQTLGTVLIAITASMAIRALTAAIKGLFITKALTAVVQGFTNALKILILTCIAHPWVWVLVAAGGAMAYFAAKSDLAAKASNKISEALNKLMGKNPNKVLQPAVEKTTQSLGDFSDNTLLAEEGLDNMADSANEAAKAAQNAVASFDEVFTLADESSNGGLDDITANIGTPDSSGLDDYLEGIDIPTVDIPTEFKMPDFSLFTGDLKERLKDTLVGAGIGAVIGGVLGAIFGGLPGAKIGAILGAGVGGIVGYFWDNMLEFFATSSPAEWAKIGKKIGETIGGIFGKKGAQAGGKIGESIGEFVGTIWDKMRDTFRDSADGKWALIGAAIGAAIGILFGPLGILAGGAIGTGAGKVVKKVWDTMKEFFDSSASERWKMIGKAIGNMINHLFGPEGLLNGTVLPTSISNFINDVWQKMLGNFKDGAPNKWAIIGSAVGALIGVLFGPLGLLAGAFLGTGVGKFVGDVWNKMKEFFNSSADEKWKMIGKSVGAFIGSLFGPEGILVGSKLGEAIGGLKNHIWDKMKQFFSGDATDKWKMVGKAAGQFIGSLFSWDGMLDWNGTNSGISTMKGRIWDKIKEIMGAYAGDGWKGVGREVGATIGNLFSWDGILSHLSDNPVVTFGSRIWSKITSNLRNIFNWRSLAAYLAGGWTQFWDVLGDIFVSQDPVSSYNNRMGGFSPMVSRTPVDMTTRGLGLVSEISTDSINTTNLPSAQDLVAGNISSTRLTRNSAKNNGIGVLSNGDINSADIEQIIVSAVKTAMENLPTPVYAGTLIADDRSLAQLSDKIEVIKKGSNRRRGL